MKYILLSITCVFYFSLFSQEKNELIIYGKIVDSYSNPIENTNIKVQNKAIGTSSNRLGFFILKHISNNDTLIISHLSYKTKTINLKVKKNFSDTIYLSIVLENKIEQIQDIVIRANNQADEIASQQIYDYLFIKNNIILLNTDTKGLYISINDIKSQLHIFSSEAKFLTDIFGNIHIQTADSVYQITITNNIVTIINTISIEKYKNKLTPIKFLTDSIMIVKDITIQENYSLHKQLNRFNILNLQSSKKSLLINLFNKENYKYCQSYYQSILKLYYKVTPESQNIIEMNMWDGNINTLNTFDPELIQEIEWYSKIAAIPLYTPLVSYNNGFSIFDFSNQDIYNYDLTGKLLKKIKIQFPKSIHLIKEILLDKVYEKTFFETLKNGFVKIWRINKNNGNIDNAILIPHRYPKNIKINDGYIYYLVESTKYGEHNKLYKMPLN